MHSGFISRLAAKLTQIFRPDSTKTATSVPASETATAVPSTRPATAKTSVPPSPGSTASRGTAQDSPPPRRRRNSQAPAARAGHSGQPAAASVSFEEYDASLTGQIDLTGKKKVADWQVPAPVRNDSSATYFQDFPLDSRIMRALLEDLQFEKCTPIQTSALQPALDGQDLAGKAQTGTGKTAVFLIATIQAYLQSTVKRKRNSPFALVLAPTRELAIQIAKDAELLSIYTDLRIVAVYGGMDYARQRQLLTSGCDLVVATPGRLLDYLRQNVLDLSSLQMLVIDEADRMLDMGFIPDVKQIISYTPKPAERQTMLFSATLTPDIMNLSARWMRPSPVILEVDAEQVVAEGIDETVFACTSQEKLPIMLWLLKNEDCHRVLIFRNRKRDVEELHYKLQRFGIASEMLSGDVDQKKRLRILEGFRSGAIQVIVATDVAGRGIHIDDVTHVFNYDLPYEAEDYVHRVGRTARAGHRGRAISFAGEDCAFVIPDIESYIGRALPITQPEAQMLVMPKSSGQPAPLPRQSSPRSPRSRSQSGDRNRSSGGSRIRRSGPRH